MNISFGSREEFYLINPNAVMYFQADDHYAHVFYTTGKTFMLPIGLSKVEQRISEQLGKHSPFVRMGRKYLVNISYLYYISTSKQTVKLVDAQGKSHVLHVAKEALLKIVDSFQHPPGGENSRNI